MTTTFKLTSKGQVTIPKEIRELLKTDTITFEIKKNHEILIKPVSEVGGSLSAYAKNVKEKASFKDIRNKAWEKSIHEKHARKLS